MTPDEIEFWERSTPVVFGSPEDHALHGAHSDRDGSEPKPYREAVRSFVDQSKAVAAVERERDEWKAEAVRYRTAFLKANEACSAREEALLRLQDRLYVTEKACEMAVERAEDAEAKVARVEARAKAWASRREEDAYYGRAVLAALEGGDDE